MSKIIIIGAGIGGLATANLLAKAGHEVHMYEKEATPGGRANQFKKDGFTFDTGPSWYLMPEVFDHYYELMGSSTSEQLDLIQLKPAYKVFYETTPPIIITSNLTADAATFESIEQGAGKALERYVAQSIGTYKLALRHFLYSNFSKLSDLLHPDITRRLPRLLTLMRTSVHRYVTGFVSDRRLQQLLEYPMVFLGTSPFKAPALYSLMSALDFHEGVFYPKGTMYAITESLVKLGQQYDVTHHYNAPVKKILIEEGTATGVQLMNGEEERADIIISNADLHFTETKLVETSYQTYPEPYWQHQEPSPSAILMYLGIKGGIPEFEHHTLLFVDAWQKNFTDIYHHKTLPHPASLYISKTSHSDATAPKGYENIFVLVPIPAGSTLKGEILEKAANQYLDQIKTMTGVDLKSRTISRTIFGPHDFQTKYYSWQASMLGPSHRLGQSALFRTQNKSKKVKNLYYVGGGTVPGVGVPMCLISAELVYKRITGDVKSGPVSSVKTTRRAE